MNYKVKSLLFGLVLWLVATVVIYFLLPANDSGPAFITLGGVVFAGLLFIALPFIAILALAIGAYLDSKIGNRRPNRPLRFYYTWPPAIGFYIGGIIGVIWSSISAGGLDLTHLATGGATGIIVGYIIYQLKTKSL